MAEGERVALVGLEERFAGDKSKVELNKVLAELDGQLVQTKRALDAGLAPQEFRNMSKYRTALEEARDVATKVWILSVKL
jgi:hypothetical protein